MALKEHFEVSTYSKQTVLVQKKCFQNAEKGVKNAVIRRSIYEFNLHLNEADLRMVQRILYFREMDHELLAEHEIDYCVLSCIDRPFAMNENEIEGNEIFHFSTFF